MRIRTRVFSILGSILFLGSFAVSLPAQSHTAAGMLAERTAQQVAKFMPMNVLVAPLSSCMANEHLCQERNADLRSALLANMPNVNLVSWNAAVRLLPRYGLLPVDAYEPHAMQEVAGGAGADILITEGAQIQGGRYVMVDTIMDAMMHKQLGQITADAPAGSPGAHGLPVLYKDPDSGAYIIMFGRLQPGQSTSLVKAKCVVCPPPTVPSDLLDGSPAVTVWLRATVDTQGHAQNIGVLQGTDPMLDRLAVQAVRSWKFDPATLNGMPVPLRVPISITIHNGG